MTKVRGSGLVCYLCFEPRMDLCEDVRGHSFLRCTACQSHVFGFQPDALARVLDRQAYLAHWVAKQGGPAFVQAAAQRPAVGVTPCSDAQCPFCALANMAMVRIDRRSRPYIVARCPCAVRAFVAHPSGLTSVALTNPGVLAMVRATGQTAIEPRREVPEAVHQREAL